MITAAARPPPTAHGDDRGPALDGRVRPRHRGTERYPCAAPKHGQKQRFGEELRADVFLSCAERAAKADFRSPLEHGDDHCVGYADATDEQRDGAEAEQQTGEGLIGGGLGGERIRGPGHVHLVGSRWIGVLASRSRTDSTASGSVRV